MQPINWGMVPKTGFRVELTNSQAYEKDTSNLTVDDCGVMFLDGKSPKIRRIFVPWSSVVSISWNESETVVPLF